MDQELSSGLIPTSLDDPQIKEPPEKNIDYSESILSQIMIWFFQIFVWIFLILSLTFYFFSPNKSRFTISLVSFFISYIAYIILEFISPTFKLLAQKRTGQGMYVKMGEFFMKPPEIEFFCECYHYKKVQKVMKTKQGTYHKTQKVRRVSHTETFRFPYYSSRDCSGLFYLNCTESEVNKKIFIKLEIQEEINFADSLSYMDYIYQKDQFWRRNRFRDYYMLFKEKRYIPDLPKYNLIRLGVGLQPVGVGIFWYILFVFIPFCQLYKMYIESFCVSQKFKLRKLISTRYNLSSNENEKKFETFNPQLNLITQKLNYESIYYNYLNQGFEVKNPTEKDFDNAKVYARNIPDYKISTGSNGLKIGVILDDEKFSNQDYNEPPPAFATLPGDVALRKIQVNKKGKIPSDFDKTDVKMKEINPDEDNNDEDDQQDMPENIMEK